MASVISRGSNFPLELSRELINLVGGKSSLAKLSAQKPLAFNGTQAFTFTFDSEVDVVAENGAKSNGGGAIDPVTIVPVKIEYGMRISDEFKYAAEETQLEYLRSFTEGFAAKAARGLDIMALHGFNPRTGSASAVIGNNHFDYQVGTYGATDTYDPTDPNGNVETLIAAIQAGDDEVTGIAVSPTFSAALAAQVNGAGNPIFPELAWGAAPETVRGLGFSNNSTVSFGNTLSQGDHAVVGNFRDYFRYGIAKDITVDLIEYGNPDNDAVAGDLKGHNQVYLRGELYLGWAILKPAAFGLVTIQ